MKIAVLSDIHGVLPALQAVLADVDAWQPDAVVVNGDIVNRGPSPLACWQLLAERQRISGWHLLRGNHEDYVVNMTLPDAPQAGPQLELQLSARWTSERLKGQIAALQALPAVVHLQDAQGGALRFVHASMAGNRDGLHRSASNSKIRKQIEPLPGVFCTAHTHWAWTRTLDATLIVNSGSVGTPFDGDERAAYAQLTWRQPFAGGGSWRAQIVRVPYDRAQTQKDFETSGYLHESGALTAVLHTEWRLARSLWPAWLARYEADVLAGKISAAQAAAHFLDSVAE